MHWLVPAAASGALLLTASRSAHAQESVPARPPGSAAAVPSLPGKYAHWRRHVGRPGETVVYARITATTASGATVVRTGSGFVLRCDGFVLLPESLAPRGDSAFRAALSFASADGEELTAPLEAVGPPRFHGRKTDYVVLKVNDHHLPCLPLLHPQNVRAGMPVQIFWAAPREGAPGRAEAHQARATVGPPAPGEGRCSLTLAEARGSGGAGEKTPPPLGAVVTDPESGAALGIVTREAGYGAGLSFTTWRFFPYVSNDVGLCPTPADAPRPDGKPGRGGADMIPVPGGPFALDGALLDEYNRAYKTGVVCLPPFSIDRLPVTVAAYRSYLRRFPAPRRPYGWDHPDELKGDYRRGDLPATGMISEDALAFAASDDKRLPTPVERFRAAAGTDVRWYQEMRQEIESTSKELVLIQRGKLNLYQQLYQSAIKADAKTGVIPDVEFWVVGSAEMDQLHDQQQEVQARFFARYWFPDQASPVGFYDQDTSAFGVGDVVTNVAEIVQFNYAARPAEVAQKPFAVHGDPYLSVLHRFGVYAALNPTARRDMDGVYATFMGLKGSEAMISYFEERGTTNHYMAWQVDGRAGFRRAR